MIDFFARVPPMIGFFVCLFFTVGVACFAYWLGYRRGRGFLQ
jgi:hypothetical protein